MNFRTLWRRAKQFRGELALISGLSLIASLSTLLVPWLAGQFLGSVVDGSIQNSQSMIIFLVGALGFACAFSIASAIFSQSAALRILKSLRIEVYEHVQSMPLAFHDSSRSGDLLALLSFEARRLSEFLATTLTTLPSMLLTAAGSVIALMWIDLSIGMFLIAALPATYIVMKILGRRMRLIARKARQAEANLLSIADSDLSLVSAIKAFATEDYHRERYENGAEVSRNLALRLAKISAFISPIIVFSASIAAIAFLTWGATADASSATSPRDLFSFILYAGLLTRPVGGLASLYGKFQIAKGTLSRLERIISIDSEAGYQSGKDLPATIGKIEFRGVTFSYANRPQIFSNLDLRIFPGEIVALTGENGVGKSTLVRLLLRFQTPQAGRILLDEKDIQEYQVQQLRRQFGYVPQRPLLFNGTIHENVIFGQLPKNGPENSALLTQALRSAHASKFIQELPQGIETVIGDHGVRLSGGQQQRLALARALLRSPPIYILDEATSMYDLESEAKFIEECVETLNGATVIIITHRPASLALADRVLKVSQSNCLEINRESFARHG